MSTVSRALGFTAVAAVVTGLALGGCAAGRDTPISSTPHASTADTDASSGSAKGTASAVPVTAGGGWRAAHVQDYGNEDSLRAVVAVAGNDAWAFGQTEEIDESPPALRLALRWDGRKWRKAPLPKGPDGAITSAGASASDNVWALGNSETSAYALRWDGRRWSVAKRFDGNVEDVQALGRHHVWVFGGHPGGAWFFNRVTWRKTRVPIDVLAADAVSQQDVWAVGWRYRKDEATAGVIHLDGGVWRNVPLTDAFPPDDDHWFVQLNSVLARGPDDIWVFGERDEKSSTEGQSKNYALAAHWDGHAWQAIPVPPAWQLGDAVADDQGGVHVLATKVNGHGQAVYSSVLSRSPNGTWSQAQPQVPGKLVTLHGLARVPGTPSLWAVGSVEPQDQEDALSTSAIFTGR